MIILHNHNIRTIGMHFGTTKDDILNNFIEFGEFSGELESLELADKACRNVTELSKNIEQDYNLDLNLDLTHDHDFRKDFKKH